MAKNESNVSRWVDERLTALDTGGDWQPDPDRGRARLRDRQRMARRRRIEWIAGSIAGAAACILLTVFLSPGACARSRSCSGDLAHPAPLIVHPAPAPPPPAEPVANAVKPTPPSPAKPAPPVANFKETGLPTAPIVCEVYTDYECPSCALLYKDTIPLLIERYVRTGKVRLLHRDFPLQQHPYARLAARYANAAGTIGQYDLVVNQLFQTQNLWSRDGNVDAQVMQVLAPGAIQKVRDLVAHDAHLDDTVAVDLNMAAGDHVDHTPTLVIVWNGRRQVMPGVPQFSMLQTYLDQLLPVQRNPH